MNSPKDKGRAPGQDLVDAVRALAGELYEIRTLLEIRLRAGAAEPKRAKPLTPDARGSVALLGSRLHKAMVFKLGAGYTLAQVARLRAAEILAIRSVGVSSLERVREVLLDAGLTLRGDEGDREGP